MADPTTATEADMRAAFERLFGPTDWTEKTWNARDEERMAAAANGQTLRRLPTDMAVSHRGRRDVADDADLVRRNGFWVYEPYSGDVA